jgi:hypothetical protein
MPSFEAPRGDEVDLFSLLTLDLFHCFGMLEVLTVVVHLQVDVCHLVLQSIHLL